MLAFSFEDTTEPLVMPRKVVGPAAKIELRYLRNHDKRYTVRLVKEDNLFRNFPYKH